ncbi:hypothetical protein DFH06DRAFT_591134 [Mycena polygramma]|nr:hypothetical protein DFH06DRAFT_591134 [Mycena polygramma]
MQTVEEAIRLQAATNDPPSDSDRIRISELLHEDAAALASLNAAIAGLRTRYKELIMLRNRRRKRVNTLRAIVSPLRILPPEILSLIFLNCPRADTEGAIQNPSRLLAPLLLVQICSRWRHVALDTPNLWTELQLVLSPRNSPKQGRVMLQNWVANASPLPISFIAECLYYPDLLQHALTQIRRFKSLRLVLSADSFGRLASCRGLDVETLNIHVDNTCPSPCYCAVFRDSPSLRSVTLKYKGYHRLLPGGDLDTFPLPWSQLTDLHISVNIEFVSLAVLLQCTSLVRCSFGILEPWADEDDIALHDPTTFPCLVHSHFTLENWDNETTEEFFRLLVLPSLKTLSLESIDIASWSPATFRSFQLRSSFELETLDMQGLYVEADEFTMLLENLPSLRSFSIGDFLADEEISISIIQALAWNDSRSLLPRLERLKLGIFQSDLGLRLFIAMIKSRLDPERIALGFAQLESVWLETESPTQSLDRWWWEWKLLRVFPTLEWRFSVLPETS